MGIKRWVLGLTAAGATGKHGIARYFFHRTVVRGDAKRDRTWKMAGTDWNAYIPSIRVSRRWLAGQPQEEVCIMFRGGLKLHGTSFCRESSGKVVVCFHGYTSKGLNDYASITKFCLSQGFSLIVVDKRARGKSEGIHIGLDCLDHNDAKQWMEYMVERLGEGCKLMPHSVSMGAIIVLIPTGLNFPEQVRTAVSDCAFISAWEVFSHVLRGMYHVPAFPVIQIANRMARGEVEYGLDERNAREEVKKAHIPILFIHRDRDIFTPCSIVHELYEVCASPKELLVIPGANHAEVYYKEADRYEYVIEELITRFFGKEENKV